jgi:hypothetical protein
MPKKMLKADYVKIIEEHFAKEGKCLSNLSKATLPKLKEIIEKYDIKFDEKSIVEENEKQKQKEKEEKEQRDKEHEEQNRIYKETMERKKTEWKGLTEYAKDKVITYVVVEKQKVYLNDYWKNKKRNEKLKQDVDKMVEKFKSEGANVERTGDNTINVNGVIISHGFYTDTFDWEEEYKRAREDMENHYDYEPFNILKKIKDEEEE